MNIGVTQSQSLISSVTKSAGSTQIGASAQSTAARILSTGKEDPKEAVTLTVNRRIDYSYTQRVLTDTMEDKLNTALEEAGLDIRAEDLLQEGTEVTPEATAARITEFAVSFYDAYKQNNADDEAEMQLDGFVELIKGAVEEGFEDSREILEGIARVPERITQDIDRTLELTMEGIDAFAEEQRSALAPPPEEGDAPSLLAI